MTVLFALDPGSVSVRLHVMHDATFTFVSFCLQLVSLFLKQKNHPFVMSQMALVPFLKLWWHPQSDVCCVL